ncbi:MAG: glycosyltransferase [Deltaproteobacteria bacterium]|nr:glycosyltransferase [Deltaproteobacteria bacterium]
MTEVARVRVVIPYHNASATIGATLATILAHSPPGTQIVAVDDGSTDDSASIVARHEGVIALSNERRSGAAVSRNRGAGDTEAPVLMFLDADVEVLPDTIERAVATLERPDGPDACFGAYTPLPGDGHFASVYKNLVHHHTHVTSSRHAHSFWCGCGAIRTQVFRESGGFDESYRASSVEDIELGYRLTSAGRRIELDPDMQVRHLKAYTFASLVRSDFWDRAVPWTLLMARRNVFYSDLNLRATNIAAAILLVLVFPLSLAALWVLLPQNAWFGPAVAAVAYLSLNASLWRCALRHLGFVRLVGFVFMHSFAYVYSVIGFGVGVALYLYERILGRPVR